MRALVHPTFGDPGQVLAVEEVPLPEPGPGKVRVRTILAAVHNHDLMTVAGMYGYRPELPARAGTEAVGVIEALGEGVTHLQVGQRVATGAAFGTWAEYFTASAAAVVPVPDSLADEAAAQIYSMPFSALTLLDSLGLAEGDWMVQNTANGAVGRYVAQLAKARGIKVLGLVRRAAGVEELASQGITDVVSTDAEDWRKQVKALTGGAPIRAGVDSIGGPASGQVLSLIAEDGLLVIFGAMASNTVELNVGDVLFKQITVKGFWGNKVAAAMTEDQKVAAFSELMQRIQKGTLELTVDSIHPLDEMAAAAEASARPGRLGKVLLRP